MGPAVFAKQIEKAPSRVRGCLLLLAFLANALLSTGTVAHALELPNEFNSATILFTAKMEVMPPVIFSENQAISFPTAIPGKAATVTISPEDTGAAVFAVTGRPMENLTASIVEERVVLSTGFSRTPARQIVVEGFTLGGDIHAASSTGSARIGQRGTLSDLRLGATARIEAEDQPGVYSGSSTFRVVYH